MSYELVGIDAESITSNSILLFVMALERLSALAAF
jgi:hypothetical protein